MRFNAVGTGSPNQGVTWSMFSGPGFIDRRTGIYTAPAVSIQGGRSTAIGGISQTHDYDRYGKQRDFTVKQHLATHRMLFDWLVTEQILEVNPAHAERSPKEEVKKGDTPVLTAAAQSVDEEGAETDKPVVAAGIPGEPDAPLFQPAAANTDTLTGRPMWRQDAYRMIQRRTRGTGIKTRIGNLGDPPRAPGSIKASEMKLA